MNNKPEWTNQQRRAITSRGSNVFVAASAGTGKTAVLAGRCVNVISDESAGLNVDNLLVLTFTDAAAEQMRQRIGHHLHQLYTETANRHLYHQMILLPAAEISTIHSFCRKIITDNFYDLAIDPAFKVIEEDEAGLLKTEALKKTIEYAWEQPNHIQAFRQLLRKRTVAEQGGFLDKIIGISTFLDCIVSPEQWYRRASILAESQNPYTTTPALNQKRSLETKLNSITEQLAYLRQVFELQNTDNINHNPLDKLGSLITYALKLLDKQQLDECAETLLRCTVVPLKKPRAKLEPVAADLSGKIIKQIKKQLAEILNLAILNPHYLESMAGIVNLQTRVLIELTKKFEQYYAELKESVNGLDFADLEHKALKLLSKNADGDHPTQPSEAALALRQKYKYIFVDEYQDINPVQKQIINLLAAGRNVFGVGDIKQCIYAFRGAEPKIFLNELSIASKKPSTVSPAVRIDLQENFRSSKGILDFVNALFRRLMSTKFAGIDYDSTAELKTAADTQPPHQPDGLVPVELHILDEKPFAYKKSYTASDTSNSRKRQRQKLSSRQRQAVAIAKKIGKMVASNGEGAKFRIKDKNTGNLRPIEYRDIVILLRSPAQRVNDYIEILQMASIPVSSQHGAGYFQTTEISDLLSLLKVLDNPQRDIELAATLRSQFFRVTDSELALIKIHTKKIAEQANFYSRLEYCSGNGPDAKLEQKLKNILHRLCQWRIMVRRGSLADAIWRIYRQSGYLSFVSALPNGRVRRANLLKLHERAIQFETFASSGPVASLNRFIEFIEKLQSSGDDWSQAQPETSIENAVHIMSIHKSKGLEFPVVFLAELNAPFNKSDAQGELLIDEDNTVGLQIIEQDSNVKLSSTAHQVIAENKLEESLAEEMRVLYVAATRAENRLILVGCKKEFTCRRILQEGIFFADRQTPDWILRQSKSPLEWVLFAMAGQKQLYLAYQKQAKSCLEQNDLFRFRRYRAEELENLDKQLNTWKNPGRQTQPIKTTLQPAVHSQLFERIKKSLSWHYYFESISKLPAKQSVSQLTHQNDEYIRADYSNALEREPKILMQTGPAGTKSSISLSIGTATHSVLEQLELSDGVTESTVRKTRDKLAANNWICPAAAEYVDIESIVEFFRTETGQMALAGANKLHREWSFTLSLPADKWQHLATADNIVLDTLRQETIVIQGIIDMVIETPDGLIIIDFKTDAVTADEVPRRAGMYTEQLNLYADSAAKILNKPVVKKHLYFLQPGSIYTLK